MLFVKAYEIKVGDYADNSKKRLRTDVSREQISERAQKIIFKSGSGKVTIKAIAAEVGISDGAVYWHFPAGDCQEGDLNTRCQIGKIENSSPGNRTTR